jgi:hypothetical protein
MGGSSIMNDVKRIEPDTYFEDLIQGCDQVGEGTSRKVYGVRDRDDVVIKVQDSGLPQGNMIEWIVWSALCEMGEDIMGTEPNPEIKSVFAECFKISVSGRYLMMERLDQIEKETPLKIQQFPDWLNDKKRSAFGLSSSGSVKVMDYGMVKFFDVLNPKNKR